MKCKEEDPKTFAEPFYTIKKGEDGIYRWIYEMNMWTNPTIIITLLKVLILAASAPILLVTLLALFEQGLGEGIEAFMTISVPVVFIMGILFAVSYPLVAIMNGGKYCVVFELDEKGVKHIHMQRQFKKAQVLAIITSLSGAITGNPTAAGAGLLAGSKQSSFSQFFKVKTIIAKKSRQVIYVNEKFEHNQIYVTKEDFDNVFEYLVSHCAHAKVKVK